MHLKQIWMLYWYQNEQDKNQDPCSDEKDQSPSKINVNLQTIL